MRDEGRRQNQEPKDQTLGAGDSVARFLAIG